ncbi:MAG: hypothetical protein KY468_16545 [Armatimonadetes bacterium]|nr:hypothetical protein [Armatimonadota bacterium]
MSRPLLKFALSLILLLGLIAAPSVRALVQQLNPGPDAGKKAKIVPAPDPTGDPTAGPTNGPSVPETPDPPPSNLTAPSNAHRAVYYDPARATSWVSHAQGHPLARYLESAGYAVLNANAIRDWMEARIAEGGRGILVFAQDIVPDTVAPAESGRLGENSLFRRYLLAGGKVVWAGGDIPFWYTSHTKGRSTVWWNAGAPRALGVDLTESAGWDLWQEIDLTPDGAAWGITKGWKSQRGIDPGRVHVVLGTVKARDRALAAGWVRYFSKPDPRSGFVRLPDTGGISLHFHDILRVAEYPEPVSPPPYLAALSPSVAANAGPVKLQLQGEGIHDLNALRLVREGEASIPGTSLTARSPVEGTVTFDLTGAAPGAWDLLAEGPNGARAAPLPHALTVGPPSLLLRKSGPLYLPDRRSAPLVTRYAGVPVTPGYRNGPAASALFRSPAQAARDSRGNLYLADTGNHAIRKISPSGEVTTFAGTGQPGSGNGQFNAPLGVAVDSSDHLYVSDTGNGRICKITPDGVVSTYLAKDPVYGLLRTPGPLAVAPDGTLYVVDGLDRWRVCYIQPSKDRGILAGLVPGYANLSPEDGPLRTSSRFATFGFEIGGIAVGPDGDIYVSDDINHRIRKITPTGEVTDFAGDGLPGLRDGPAPSARFHRPQGLSFDAAGNLYVADTHNHRIRKISPDGKVSTVAGSGPTGAENLGYADGSAPLARFALPGFVLALPSGALLVSDTANHALRRISPE